MPVYKLSDIEEELVTPKHSTALGRLVTGEQIEVGLLRYKAGEGAEEHAHPHEQVLLVLSGRVRMKIGGENVPHSLHAIEDTEVVSAKGIVGGVGHRI